LTIIGRFAAGYFRLRGSPAVAEAILFTALIAASLGVFSLF
jgi:hypothetical protein